MKVKNTTVPLRVSKLDLKPWARPMRLIPLCIVALSALACSVPRPQDFATDQEVLRQGEVLSAKGNHSDALEFYENILQRFPQSPLRKEASYNIAETYFKKHEFLEAESAYADFRALYPQDPRLPHVLLRMAQCHEEESPSSVARDLGHRQRAVHVLTDLIARYPSSPEADKARVLLERQQRKLKGQDMYVADFYLKRKKYAAAIGRLEDLAQDTEFPDLQSEAQYKLALALEKTKEPERAQVLYERLRQHPKYGALATKALLRLEKLPKD